jgi:YVTN family beta-propeller protein
MFMKRIVYILISFGVLFIVFRLSIFLFRLPSYTIQTSGKLYIVNKTSRNIEVFNLFTGTEVAEIPIDLESHEAVALAGQNKVVVTNYETVDRDGNRIKVINTQTNKVEKAIDLKGKIKSNGIVAFTESNKVAVIDYVSNNLLILNIKTANIEKQIPTQQNGSLLLVLHPNKAIAYVTNIKSKSVSVIDLNKNKVIKIIPCGLGTESIAITPDGSELWVTNIKANSITIINTTTYAVTATLSTGEKPMKLKFSVDGKYCLVANAGDGTISVYNQKSKNKIKTIHIHGKTTRLERMLYHTPVPVNILMHPNGLYAFIANSNANKIEVIDMRSFTIVSTIGTGNIPDAMAFME